MRWRVLALFSGLCLAAWSRAGGPECRLQRSAEGIQVELRAPEIFSGALEQLLDSGFELALGYTLELLGPDGRTLASGRLELQAAYDLWNEEYSVAASTGAPAARQVFRSRRETLERLRRCELELPLAAPAAPVLRLRVRARLEPASAGPAQAPADWLRQPAPTGAEQDARGANLFTGFLQLLDAPEPEERHEEELLLGPWPVAPLQESR